MKRTVPPAERERRSASLKQRWQDPEYRARQAAGNRRFWDENPDAAARFGVLYGQKSPKAPKLSDDQVREIRLRLAGGDPVGEIAEDYDVSSPIISFIKAGKTYRRVV